MQRLLLKKVQWTGLLILLFVVVLLPDAYSQDKKEGFTVRSAWTRLVDEVYYMSARVDYEFSKEALEALENGVPLDIKVYIEVEGVRNYMWNETVATLVQHYRLAYHALAEQYIVENLNSGTRKSFPSRYTAVSSMGTIDNLPILDRELLSSDKEYRGKIRARLDLESLPAPLRPWAWFTPSWRLSSDWYTWSLKP